MGIIQRHVPAWDNVEAIRAEAAEEMARMSIKDIFTVALVTAVALKGIPGIEGSTRAIYDRCCDSFIDIYSTPERADLGRADYAKIREAVWESEHPTPPRPTFADFVDIMRPPVFIKGNA